jgi:hypothetical protein
MTNGHLTTNLCICGIIVFSGAIYGTGYPRFCSYSHLSWRTAFGDTFAYLCFENRRRSSRDPYTTVDISPLARSRYLPCNQCTGECMVADDNLLQIKNVNRRLCWRRYWTILRLRQFWPILGRISSQVGCCFWLMASVIIEVLNYDLNDEGLNSFCLSFVLRFECKQLEHVASVRIVEGDCR